MNYTIKDLKAHWLSKTFIYDALKNDFDFSNEFIKNKRVFNQSDLNIFLFYKKNWTEETVLNFKKSLPNQDTKQVDLSNKNSSETVWELFENRSDNMDSIIQKEVELALKTVSKQFKIKETEILKDLEQQKEIVKIRNEQTQKYALLKTEEYKEKKEWIKKYEQEVEKKDQWISKFYTIKLYLIVSILFLVFLIVILTLILIFPSFIF